ncbi:E1-E2 ATPase-domain-containing protein [Gloeopeniophorella convolvens]|nr:E1-E2 ATPase-domain-containing protein [Gloeopeniophorella convolvens]
MPIPEICSASSDSPPQSGALLARLSLVAFARVVSSRPAGHCCLQLIYLPGSAEPSCDGDCCEDEACQEAQECGGSEEPTVRYVVGDCIPDGKGGCQRSTRDPSSGCCPPTGLTSQAPCCQEDTHSIDEPGCEDSCCIPESASPAINSPQTPSEQDCCSDCHSDIGPAEARVDTCLAEGQKHAPADSSQGTVTRASSESEPDHHHTDHSQAVRRRTARRAPADEDSHSHTLKRTPSHSHGRHVHNSKCELQSTFGRFFEAACCCLIDWRVKPPTKRHHHHHSRTKGRKASHSYPPDHASSSKKDDHFTVTEEIVEYGSGQTKTLSLSVQGMDCPSCARKVTKALLTLPSVREAKVNAFTGQASLTYTEGLVFPSDISKRATELTGFSCAVLEEVCHEGKNRSLHVAFPPHVGSPWEKISLPPGVSIISVAHTPLSAVLDVQYDAALVQPRSVLGLFTPLGGDFLPPSKTDAAAQIARVLSSLFRRTLISAILCLPVLILAWAPIPAHPTVYGAISLAFASIVQVYTGAPIYSAAIRSLFLQRILDMDVLISLSSTIAYVYSIVAYAAQVAGHAFSTPFFETPTLLLTLITLGRLVSAFASRRATSALDGLGTLQTDLVQLVSTDDVVTTIPADLVHPHDVLRVPGNSLVPTDGTVRRGTTQVDESALTGESMPVDKAPGAPLTAGTFNISSSIDMEVTRVPAENTLADVAALVSRLQEARLPVQDLADRAASLLAPVILALGVVVFIIWIVIGLRVREEGSSKAGLAALRYAIAVMVVSCPCAIVLCVPMVVVIAGAVAAKEGVLFKTATAVQHVKNTSVVVFDKTGTLTLGQMAVVEAHIVQEDAVAAILALTAESPHPVAQAVAKHIRTTNSQITATPLSTKARSIPGQGLEATVGDALIRGGSPAWLGLEDEAHCASMKNKALTMFAVTLRSQPVAIFGLADTPRPSARAAIELLEREGITAHIVSGDAPRVVHALAAQLGIPPERAHGGCLPREKVARVRALQARPGARVMFIGDGTNDTPALAAADIGVAMGGGTAAARGAADVVLLAPDLARALGALLRVSRGAVRRVAANFAWAGVYNVVAVLLAAGAFVHVRVAPQYAGLGEMVSVVPVVLVAWSLWFLKY